MACAVSLTSAPRIEWRSGTVCDSQQQGLAWCFDIPGLGSFLLVLQAPIGVGPEPKHLIPVLLVVQACASPMGAVLAEQSFSYPGVSAV